MFNLFKKEKVSDSDFIKEQNKGIKKVVKTPEIKPYGTYDGQLPVGLMYADVATLTDNMTELTDNMTDVKNFALRCIHKEYVLGYISKDELGNKIFTTVMETKVRTFPYFDNVTEAEAGLEHIEDKNFVINANSITSFGIKEPADELDIYNTLSKHSMNFRFLDQDRLEKEKHGRLYERK